MQLSSARQHLNREAWIRKPGTPLPRGSATPRSGAGLRASPPGCRGRSRGPRRPFRPCGPWPRACRPLAGAPFTTGYRNAGHVHSASQRIKALSRTRSPFLLMRLWPTVTVSLISQMRRLLQTGSRSRPRTQDQNPVLDFYYKEMCHFLNFKLKQPPSPYFGMPYLILVVPAPLPFLLHFKEMFVCMYGKATEVSYTEDRASKPSACSY